MSIAGELAEFFVATSFKDLPEKVVENTKMLMADTIGSAVAASESRSVQMIHRLTLERGGIEESSLWVTKGLKASVADAARANAVMTDALVVEESHQGVVAHLSTVDVPVAIAMGEKVKASGKEVIAAVALGYEASGRIGESISPQYMYKHGFHNSVVTIFSGAVAAGKLLGLNPEQLTHAIVLAATFAAGLGGSRRTPARGLHAGNSAMQGVNAALAAQRGFRGKEDILEDPVEGYCASYGRTTHVEDITQKLGQEWDMVTDMALKLAPTGHPLQAPIEAALGAVKKGNVHHTDIDRITVASNYTLLTHAIYYPQEHPLDSHSIPYCMAVAIMDGGLSWETMPMDKTPYKETWELQGKIEIIDDQGPWNYYAGSTVTIITKDGRQYTHSVDYPKGSPQRGIDWD